MNPWTHPERRRRVTGRRASDPQPSDGGLLGWWRAFYSQWSAELQLGVGIVLLIVASVVTIVAWQVKDLSTDADVRSRIAAQTSASSRTQSRESCRRTRSFGPALADAYEKYQILTAAQIKAYRESIPAHCP